MDQLGVKPQPKGLWSLLGFRGGLEGSILNEVELAEYRRCKEAMSLTCPPDIREFSVTPWASHSMWIFVLNPPRLRPSECSASSR